MATANIQASTSMKHPRRSFDARRYSTAQRAMTEGFHLHADTFQNTVYLEQLIRMQEATIQNNKKMIDLQRQSLFLHQQTHEQMEIHLTEHEGYDIAKPAEFFKKYGSYILAVMYMFKMGTAAEGVVVPPLAGFRADGEFDSSGRFKECMQHIKPLVDDSIAFLQDLVLNNLGSPTGSENPQSLSDMRLLEGVDIQQLESYLRIKDGHRFLGGLYRTVTSKGHVNWVCKNHHRANNQESSITALREFAQKNHGTLEEQLGELKVGLGSSQSAKDLKDVLATVPGIQKLVVGFWWEATMDDLKDFAEAIAMTNIVDLTIEGSGLIGWTMDILHRFERFDPLWQLGNNGKIQSLRFVLFKDLFYRLSHDAFTPSSKLRVLKLHSAIDGGSKHWQSNLKNIFACYTDVVELGVRLKDQRLLLPVIKEILSSSQALKKLELYFGDLCTTAIITRGAIQTIQLYMPFTEAVAKDDYSHSSYFTVLDDNLIKEQAVGILELSPTLAEMVIGCRFAIPYSMVETIATTAREFAGKELRKVELIRFQDTCGAHCPKVTMDFNDRTGSLGCSFDISMMSLIGISDPFVDIFHNHGGSIKTLAARNGVIDDEMARILNQGTQDKITRFKSLTFDTKCLSLEGIKLMDRVLRNSHHLEHFALDCHSLDNHEERKKSEVLASHSQRMTELCLYGSGSEQVTKWIVDTFPSRRELSRLSELQLALRYDSSMDRHVFVPWLTRMVSAPQLTMGSQAVSPDLAHTAATWTSLKRISLPHHEFKRNDWTSILKAIDFSALEVLELRHTNFTDKELELLIHRVNNVEGFAPLRILDLSYSSICSMDLAEMYSKLDGLGEKAPHVAVKGLGAH
ncbi:hypothetical protein BGX31_010039 [Mortierella sp. GBA43]|nr:hypothetical protein BGX31_010039 [Mortierella sp. GBA43]